MRNKLALVYAFFVALISIARPAICAYSATDAAFQMMQDSVTRAEVEMGEPNSTVGAGAGKGPSASAVAYDPIVPSPKQADCRLLLADIERSIAELDACRDGRSTSTEYNASIMYNADLISAAAATPVESIQEQILQDVILDMSTKLDYAQHLTGSGPKRLLVDIMLWVRAQDADGREVRGCQVHYSRRPYLDVKPIEGVFDGLTPAKQLLPPGPYHLWATLDGQVVCKRTEYLVGRDHNRSQSIILPVIRSK